MPFTELVGTSTLMELDGVRRTTVSTVSQSLPPLGILHDGREVRPHGRKGRTHGIVRAHVKDGDVDAVLVQLATQRFSLLGKGKLMILIAGPLAIGHREPSAAAPRPAPLRPERIGSRRGGRRRADAARWHSC